MNYIKRIEAENAVLRQALATAHAGLDGLSAYVLSPKYWQDTNVNAADVSLRVTEAKSRVYDVLINAELSVEGVW